MSFTWLPDDWSTVWRIPAASALALVWAVLSIRIIGRRSLSKMTNVDFVSTVALGSIVANVAATSTSFWKGALAFTSLLAVQWVIAKARLSDRMTQVLDNDPLLLMEGPVMLGDAMRSARVTEGDLWAKLREANVTDLSQVRAVVLETTGDISVLHGESLDQRVLSGVVSPDRASD